MSMSMLPIATLFAISAPAQDAAERAPTIQVLGTATVETPPDRARISYWVNGEGKTADAASAALAARNTAVVDGVRTLLGRGAEVTASEVSVTQVRGPDCDRQGGYTPRLSEGPCAVIGHVATLQGHIRTAVVDKAATAVGLVARLGARDARIQAYELGDRSAALRRATAAAVADARARAEALATGAGVRLGELIALNDPNASNDEVNDAGVRRRIMNDLAAPPAMLATAVPIAVTPRPIQTQARVNARFAIAR
ncbi:SIMPL domain-containing protein [Sphingomonas sp. 2R-10]|uniref:SIMPL domain-containing protein n=1 Tax=Sphingomonas sp. 2R-10 TaxID=3045148 RepID=UPI000F7B1462|nr:SIMPL domain-containing protein [Sphingomonas sp. 2R-10]MDJ0277116.1 SIMPL domain-containing protein [Sphingomonas sp. 2R-10]